jgi:hypothetical protein
MFVTIYEQHILAKIFFLHHWRCRANYVLKSIDIWTWKDLIFVRHETSEWRYEYARHIFGETKLWLTIRLFFVTDEKLSV